MQNKSTFDITSCPDTVTYRIEGFFSIFRISCKCIWILSVTSWISSFLFFIKGKSVRSLNNSVLSPVLKNEKNANTYTEAYHLYQLSIIFHSMIKYQRVGNHENKALIPALSLSIYGWFLNFFEDRQNYLSKHHFHFASSWFPWWKWEIKLNICFSPMQKINTEVNTVFFPLSYRVLCGMNCKTTTS